jgi:hypothetical protein
MQFALGLVLLVLAAGPAAAEAGTLRIDLAYNGTYTCTNDYKVDCTGTASGTDGAGNTWSMTAHAVVTSIAPDADGCYPEDVTATITNQASSGTLSWHSADGKTCPDDPATPAVFYASGTFTITSADGQYAGSTGSGSFTENDQNNTPTFTGKQTMNLQVPDKPAADAMTQAASGITDTGATLNGTVDSKGFDTTYHFEYGTSTSYGSKTADASAGAGSGAALVSAAVSGLAPGTTYHFRLVATNANGTSNGADMTFATPPIVTGTVPAKRVVKNLLTVKFTTSGPGSAKGSLKLGSKTIGTGKLTYPSAGTQVLKIKLAKSALQKLKKKKGFVRVSLTLVVSDAAGNQTTVKKTLRIRA